MLPAPVYFPQPSYTTPPQPASFLGKSLPNFAFYSSFIRIVFSHCLKANLMDYSGKDWSKGSFQTLRALEKSGIRFFVEGMEHITATESPCVFIANHMSTLETFILPSLIRPRRKVTFVAKKELVELPFFGKLFQARYPISVSRTNPKQDYLTVIEEGVKRLNKGISIIVFPQSTRAQIFDPALFNSMGIKLAKKANVPVIPIALHTAAWGMGNVIKDFGPILPDMPVHFAFGEPINITGSGKEEHSQVCEFISTHLDKWNASLVTI